jgi:repressor of nif and glnA expression
MRKCGFVFPIQMGNTVLNLQPNPHRISIASFSGMNFIANATEQGVRITTEIGAGNIRFSKIADIE